MIMLLSCLFCLYLSISASYCMNEQSTYSGVHHGLLVLSNQRSANPRSELSLHLSLSNQVNTGHMQNLSPVSNIQSISPRTLVQKNTVTKTFYETNTKCLKTALCDAARELQTLVSTEKKDFAASLYFYLKDSINNASINKTPEPILHFLYDSFIELEPYLFDKNGSLKTLTASDVKRINSIIDECKATTINKIEMYGTQWCAYDALGDSQNLERLQNQGLSLLNRGIDVFFVSSSPEVFGRFERALNERDYARAWSIVKDVDSKSRPFLESVYQKCFVENFNRKGIDRRFINDPFAQDLMQRLPDSTIPSVHNIELKKRSQEKNKFLDRCGIESPTTEVELFAYQLVDSTHLSMSQKIEKICNFASSSDNVTYQQLCFSNGLPRIAKYNKEVLDAQFTDAFHTQAHIKDRILIAKIGLLDSSDPVLNNHINNVIGYIRLACSDNPLALEYGRFGHALGQTILTDDAQWRLNLPNMLHEPQSKHFSNLKQEVIKYIGVHIYEDSSYCSKIGTMYERMLQGDEIAQSFLEQAFMPEMSDQILAIDIDDMHKKAIRFAPSNYSEVTIKQFDKLASAYRDIQNNGIIYSEKTCSVDLKTRLFMHVRGEKYQDHHIYRGNQLDHAIHDNILENYYRGARLKESDNQSQMQEMADVAQRSNLLADQSLQVRDYVNAIHLAAFASYAYDYIENFGRYLLHSGRQVAEGSAEGLVAGIKSIAHQVTHPIQTAQNMAQGLGNLAILLYRINKHQPPMLPIILDPVNSSRDCAKYFHEIGIDIDALENKLAQMTLKDVTKETVQFITEGVLAGEVLKFSGAVCRTLKTQASLLAHDAQLMNVSDKVALAIGEIEPSLETAVKNSIVLPAENQAISIAQTLGQNKFKNYVEFYLKKLPDYSEKFERMGIEIPSKKLVKHIINSHYEVGPDFNYNLAHKNIRVSTFNLEENFIDLALETIEKGSKTSPNSFVYDFKRIIGVDKSGNATSKVFVALSDGKKITTAFPME